MLSFHILTLFPEYFDSPMESSIVGRARQKGLISVETTNIRDYADNKHNRVDDVPFGGGGGMVMQPGPVVRAIEELRESSPEVHVVHLSPKGRPFTQDVAFELAQKTHIGLVCGHYEGIDARAEDYMDDAISIGDFILTGGETASIVLVDAVSRLREGVLGNPTSPLAESHTGDPLLEHPHYTRPRNFRGADVPEILLSGNHAAIDQWRREASLKETLERRPELLEIGQLSKKDRTYLTGLQSPIDQKTGKKT